MTKARITVRQTDNGKLFALLTTRTILGKPSLRTSGTYLDDIYRRGGVSELADWYRQINCNNLLHNLMTAIRVS